MNRKKKEGSIRIQYVSDVHVDIGNQNIQVLDRVRNNCGADILVVAGDIAGGFAHRHDRSLFPYPTREDARGQEFLDHAWENWEEVVVCEGNHDFLYGPLPWEHPGTREKLMGITFICTPLYSLVPEDVFRNANMSPRTYIDFVHIHGSGPGDRLSIADYNTFHGVCVAWLETELQQAAAAGETVVVVTHHAPSARCIGKRFLGNPLNPLFHADMDRLIRRYGKSIAVWFHGHSHCFNEQSIWGVPVLRNPFGYSHYNESVPYKTRFFDIDLSTGPKKKTRKSKKKT